MILNISKKIPSSAVESVVCAFSKKSRKNVLFVSFKEMHGLFSSSFFFFFFVFFFNSFSVD